MTQYNTEAERKAAAFLSRKKPALEPPSPEQVAAREKAEREAALKTFLNLEVGEEAPDGSVCAGTAEKGKKIFAAPNDLSIVMTFNDAAKAVEKLNKENYLGHSDWQIPELDTLKTLYQNRNEGSLAGTFNTSGQNSGSDFPGWYWTSTEHRDVSSNVRVVRFSVGLEGWIHKDGYRFSCRPVRLVPYKF